MGLLSFLKRSTATRRFDAGAGGRRWSAQPSFGRTGAETLAASAPIRSKARYFFANNPWAANGVNALAIGLIGAGIKAAPQHPDPDARKLLGEAFTRWAKIADAEGRTDLHGLMAAAVLAMIVDGESFIVFEHRPEGLRLRLLPAEMVNESDTRELPGGGYVVAGIEFNAAGERVAYHVLKNRPTDVFASTWGSTRLPAEDVLHLMRPLGAGQVRGISWAASILLRLSELDQTEDALIVGTKIAAMFAGFLVDLNNTSGADPFEGQSQPSLEPGTLQRLPGGVDVKFGVPQQAQQTAEFVSHQIRAISAGLGVPAHLVSNDLREASYGSLRAGMIAYKGRLEAIQFGTIIPQLCEPIYARAITALVLHGDIAAPDFESAQSEYLAVEHYPPTQPWLDPAKDAAATRDMITAGLMSRRQAVAALGYDIEALDSEIAADRERETRLGLTFGSTPDTKEKVDDNPNPDPKR
ncbi:phage portal protein [Mesorhizobium sp. A623]